MFRFTSELYREDLVNLVTHGKDISQMVWSCIWVGSRSDLVIMERNLDSPQNGYSTNSYLWALEEGLLLYYKPGNIFQQDNAPIHTSGKAKEWLEQYRI